MVSTGCAPWLTSETPSKVSLGVTCCYFYPSPQDARSCPRGEGRMGPGHLMDLDVAGDVGQPRQEAGVVPAGRRQLAGHGRDVVVLPDLHGSTDGQPVALNGQAHRLGENPEGGVWRAAGRAGGAGPAGRGGWGP